MRLKPNSLKKRNIVIITEIITVQERENMQPVPREREMCYRCQAQQNAFEESEDSFSFVIATRYRI